MGLQNSANGKPCLKRLRGKFWILKEHIFPLQFPSPLQTSKPGKAVANWNFLIAAALTKSCTCRCRSTIKDSVFLHLGYVICRSSPMFFMLHCFFQTLHSLEHLIHPKRTMSQGWFCIALCFGSQSPEIHSCRKGHTMSPGRSLHSLRSEEQMLRSRSTQWPLPHVPSKWFRLGTQFESQPCV